MGDKILSHDEALKLVYSVIAVFRTEGKTKITISEVAKNAGISRSTMNSKHEDWVEIRDIIQNNKFSDRVKLASDVIRERTKWQIEAAKLEKEVQNCQDNLSELTDFADSVYKRLLNELHKYVYKARKVPEHMDRESKTLLELQELTKQVEYYEAEIQNLKAKSVKNGTIRVFAKKEVIDVFESKRANLNNLDFLDLTMDALYKLDNYFVGPHPPKVVYVLCGNFASGKSTWIADHAPIHEGINIYFDGTNHSISLRQRIIKHIRKYKTECKIVCVRTFCDVEKCLIRNTSDTRVRYKNSLSDELITCIDENFEEVSVTEGFNEIIIAEGSHV
jgi:hypothetical protein